jgi:hypothetical protein
MFSTLICVFTLDRIGRRKTLYWGSVGQGIAMFLVGGLSTGGLKATAAGDIAAANKWGAAAAAMVFLYTFIFGATWLTVRPVHSFRCDYMTDFLLRFRGFILLRYFRCDAVQWGIAGELLGGALAAGMLPNAQPLCAESPNANLLFQDPYTSPTRHSEWHKRTHDVYLWCC